MTTLSAWIYLVLAGGLEIIWALTLKKSDGFTHVMPAVVAVVTAGVSFALLGLALRTLPVATAYAVWVGIGTAGVALVGTIVLDEPMSLPRIGCIALIAVGVVGLKLLDG